MPVTPLGESLLAPHLVWKDIKNESGFRCHNLVGDAEHVHGTVR